jgi:hypothetical protein
MGEIRPDYFESNITFDPFSSSTIVATILPVSKLIKLYLLYFALIISTLMFGSSIPMLRCR